MLIVKGVGCWKDMVMAEGTVCGVAVDVIGLQNRIYAIDDKYTKSRILSRVCYVFSAGTYTSISEAALDCFQVGS
jgi:hypothetical protein